LVGTTMENLLGHGKKQTPKEFSLVKGWWFIYDLYMNYIWFVYDLYMIYIWFILILFRSILGGWCTEAIGICQECRTKNGWSRECFITISPFHMSNTKTY
jgi:hypothetical protein